jgi:hypothetical protein
MAVAARRRRGREKGVERIQFPHSFFHSSGSNLFNASSKLRHHVFFGWGAMTEIDDINAVAASTREESMVYKNWCAHRGCPLMFPR